MKKLNKNIVLCSFSPDDWLLLAWYLYVVPFFSYRNIYEYINSCSVLCTIGIMWVNLFLKESWSYSESLFKEIHFKVFVNKQPPISIFCLHILNISVKNYNLAPLIMNMKRKLFESENGLCILKISNQQIQIGEIFLHIRCICFMINLIIKDKLSEHLKMLFEKCFPKESELFTVVSKTAFTENFFFSISLKFFIEYKQLRRDL